MVLAKTSADPFSFWRKFKIALIGSTVSLTGRTAPPRAHDGNDATYVKNTKHYSIDAQPNI